MCTIALLKKLVYLMNNCNCCYITVKLKWDGCMCFGAFNTVLFTQKLLQLVLWNKYTPLKEQDCNGFPQTNIPFKFSWINYRPFVIMDDCKMCCKINTPSLTNGSLQVLPWNNDTTIEKIDACSQCCQLTDPFQYIHPWIQRGIIIDNYDISLLQFVFCKNTLNLKECVSTFAP